jgi:UDP-glucose:(heptosyl)LPS alpha-1,3-glucosyltransferase
LKIILCIKNLSNEGGQERFLSRLATFLLTRGHEVKILTARHGTVPGVDVRVVSGGHSPLRSARDWAYSRAIAKALVSEKADVTFGEQKTWGCQVIRPGGGSEDEYWIQRFRDWRFPIPMPPALRFLSLKRFFDIRAERNGYAAPELRRVIANSRMVRDALVVRYPRLREKIEIVYNGCNTERFHPDHAQRWRNETAVGLGLDPQALTGICVGYGFRLKGVGNAIAAVALARRRAPGLRKLQLIVVGRGQEGACRRQVVRLGLEENVRFVGNTATPERYYAAADFLIFPTFYDPCANVTLEALASGIPVITTARNGAGELLEGGNAGLVVEHPRDLSRMADWMLGLKDPDILNAQKTAARALAMKHPLEGKLARIEAILCECAAARPAPSERGSRHHQD